MVWCSEMTRRHGSGSGSGSAHHDPWGAPSLAPARTPQRRSAPRACTCQAGGYSFRGGGVKPRGIPPGEESARPPQKFSVSQIKGEFSHPSEWHPCHTQCQSGCLLLCPFASLHLQTLRCPSLLSDSAIFTDGDNKRNSEREKKGKSLIFFPVGRRNIRGKSA